MFSRPGGTSPVSRLSGSSAGQVQLPSDAVGYAAEDKTSGVINYLNRFGRNPKSLGNYKANDPVGELYYETLRYMQGMGAPTPAAVRDLDDRMLDGSPVYTGWDDPYGSDLGYSQTTDYSCIRSQIVLVGDINAHDANSSPKYPGKSADKDVVRGHLASPSDSKNVPNAITWRNRAQNLEAAAGISLKTGNYHMWSILPGLSYWAHMNDIRSTNWTEEPEKQRPGLRLTSFFFDVNEANLEYNYSNREARNQYWLAAKYGVDILNHTPKDEPVPMDIINEIKQKDLTVIPTTVMQEGIVRNMQKVMPERAGNFENVLETVRRLHEAGVRMLVGTDSNRTNKMCFITHGESIFREFDFLHDAGLTNLDILHGATSTAADIFGLSDRGSIAVGKRADLVLVEGDPTKDISACRNIKKVWVKGVEAIL